jgi:hypothetical protein
MLTTAKLFQLLNEAIVLLLGALLILLAISGRVGLPTRPAALVALGVIFIYWGARAWVRREPTPVGSSSKIRAGSLVLVGLLVLGIPVLLELHPVAFGACRSGIGISRDSRHRPFRSKPGDTITIANRSIEKNRRDLRSCKRARLGDNVTLINSAGSV